MDVVDNTEETILAGAEAVLLEPTSDVANGAGLV